MLKSRTHIATPPGATVREQIVDRGMTQKEFALRMDLSEKHVSKLLNGDVQLTPNMAVRLEMVLGIPAKFWNNLEAIYREKLTRVQEEQEMEADLALAKKFPYRALVQMQWVPDTAIPTAQVFNLRKFFEVVRLTMVMDTRITGMACRRLLVTERSNFALVAWVQKAKLAARNRETQPIDLQGLQRDLADLRAMTTMSPDEFCQKLMNRLAARGIVLVFLPHIPGSFLHGATFHDGPKIVMGMTVRGRDADKFWFSLFHELGHVLLGHVGLAEGTSDKDEEEANAFARDTLIPIEMYQSFTRAGNFSKKAIVQFAESIGLAPGIVLGRLQKEGLLPYNRLNDLKIGYMLTA